MPELYVDEAGNPVNMGGGASPFVPQFSQQKNDKADLLDKIRPDAIVTVIKFQLQGYEYNESTQKWVLNDSLKELALTHLGASMIANLMLPASSQNVSITNLKDQEIKKRLKSIARTAIYLAVENWETFGVRNPSQLNFINEIVFTNTLAVLKQPENGGIQKLIGHSISEQRSTQTVNAEKHGLFSMFGGRRK